MCDCCLELCCFVGRDRAVFISRTCCVGGDDPTFINIAWLIGGSHMLFMRIPSSSKAHEGPEGSENVTSTESVLNTRSLISHKGSCCRKKWVRKWLNRVNGVLTWSI